MIKLVYAIFVQGINMGNVEVENIGNNSTRAICKFKSENITHKYSMDIQAKFKYCTQN